MSEPHAGDASPLANDAMSASRRRGSFLSFGTLVATVCVIVIGGDSTRLRQILLKPLANAVELTDHGQVAWTVERDGEDLRWAARDRGIGLDVAGIAKSFLAPRLLEQMGCGAESRRAGARRETTA